MLAPGAKIRWRQGWADKAHIYEGVVDFAPDRDHGPNTLYGVTVHKVDGSPITTRKTVVTADEILY